MRTANTVDGEVVFDNGDPNRPEYDADVAKLADLRDKGWDNLTNAEKADLVRLFFQAARAR